MNGQNVKCARFSIPHSYSGMDRMPFHPFCSQNEIQDGGRRDERCGFKYVSTREKSGCTFGQNETLLLISLYQKYKENCCDNGCNGSLFVGRHICYAMFTRSGPTGVFLCRQSELFLAFRTNHSYSRIVDKERSLKQCPEMHANKTHELYGRHHKVSPALNSY